MIYHGGRRFGLSENEQSLIFWTCRNYYRLSHKQRNAIDEIIDDCANGERDALFEMITTGKSLTAVAMKHYISESALWERCARFFKEAAKKL